MYEMADLQTRGITLTDAVLLRPAMYTMNGTFAEVVAFLVGYFSGAAKGNPSAPPVIEWSAFEYWLADRLNAQDGGHFRRIHDAHREDCERLRALSELYTRFTMEYERKR
jgi:hypothetical protein